MKAEQTKRLTVGQITRGQFTCACCGTTFKPKSGAKGEHCSLECFYKTKAKSSFDQFPDFIRCTSCHAKVGFGCGVSARMVNKDKSTVVRAWRRLKIKTELPEGGSWRVYSAKSNISKRSWWGGDDAATGWMQEYKVKFPDWSSIYSIQKQREYSNNRQKQLHKQLPKDHPWRLKKICRTRIYCAIKRCNSGVRLRKANRTTQLIGCSMEKLKSYLESKFKQGMTWDNHGSKWHIDHIIPCAAFDFTDPDQIFKCFHYTNLQPLWAHENLSKSDKVMIGSKILTRGRSIKH